MDIERRLEIADRHIWNAIHEMIQLDPVKALVELITNADDSYARLEAQGARVSGRIIVDVCERRRGQGSQLVVRDEAEGFDLLGLDARVGRMGEVTSGLERGTSVRGVWGDGLKEAALGLGVGATITAIRDEVEVGARLRWSEQREPLYARYATGRPVTADRRRELELSGNGTVVRVDVGEGVSVPRHDTLVRRLSLHHALRDITSTASRQIIVRRLRGDETQREDRARFAWPVRDPELAPILLRGHVPGFGDAYEIEVARAVEPLSGPEEGPYRVGGLIVQSGRALVDVSFFGLEHRPGTEYLFGRVRCPDLYQRMRRGDPVLTRNRTGLNRDNPFSRALIAAVEEELLPVVRQEAERLSVGSTTRTRHAPEARFDEVLRALDRIGRNELAGTPEHRTRAASPAGEPQPPAAALAWRHPETRIDVARWCKRDLLVGAELAGRELNLEAVGDLEIEPTHHVLEASTAGGIVVVVRIRGGMVGAGGTVTARVDDHRAELRVRVVGRRDRASLRGPHVVRKIRIDEREDARRRAVLLEATGVLTIFVNEPSLRRYLGDRAHRDEEVSRVLLAEVITRTFCEYIAMRGYAHVYMGEVDDPVAAVMAKVDQLVHAHGAVIHAAVNPPPN